MVEVSKKLYLAIEDHPDNGSTCLALVRIDPGDEGATGYVDSRGMSEIRRHTKVELERALTPLVAHASALLLEFYEADYSPEEAQDEVGKMFAKLFGDLLPLASGTVSEQLKAA